MVQTREDKKNGTASNGRKDSVRKTLSSPMNSSAGKTTRSRGRIHKPSALQGQSPITKFLRLPNNERDTICSQSNIVSADHCQKPMHFSGKEDDIRDRNNDGSVSNRIRGRENIEKNERTDPIG